MASPTDMWSRSANLSEAPKQASTCSHAHRLGLTQSPLATLQQFAIDGYSLPAGKELHGLAAFSIPI